MFGGFKRWGLVFFFEIQKQKQPCKNCNKWTKTRIRILKSPEARWTLIVEVILVSPTVSPTENLLQDSDRRFQLLDLGLGLGILDFCTISRRLISKTRFLDPISVEVTICGTCFHGRDSKRRALGKIIFCMNLVFVSNIYM